MKKEFYVCDFISSSPEDCYQYCPFYYECECSVVSSKTEEEIRKSIEKMITNCQKLLDKLNNK